VVALAVHRRQAHHRDAHAAGEPMPRVPDPAWNAYWRIDPRPGGHPAPDWPGVSYRRTTWH
jgi:hypothetical protein